MYTAKGDAHLFDNELPYWLAIGPICWNATYSVNHRYLMIGTMAVAAKINRD